MKDQEEINLWAVESLAALGHPSDQVECLTIQTTPYSYVARLETPAARFYVKHVPEKLAFEPEILKLLRTKFNSPVPEVIAQNDHLDCFLMPDAGVTLRTALKDNFDTGLVCQVIDAFTKMQISTKNSLESFFELGVPDWRLERLPQLFHECLDNNEELFKRDGLTEGEFVEARRLVSMVDTMCASLTSFGIPQTIVQPDFNDNNSLINNTSLGISLIDLGEIVVSHPFFSLVNCLYKMRVHHGLQENGPCYGRIQDACLVHYDDNHGARQALQLADALGVIYGILGQHRLMQICGFDAILSFQPGKLALSLRQAIDALCG